MNIKELVNKPQKLAPGHRSCAGCTFPIIARTVLSATDDPIVAACATGCMEVTTTIYPYSSWKIPFIHSAFENAGATISGAEAAFQAMKKKGKIQKEVKFIAFGGDGGTYDIGLQSLSGALERGHDFVYVCYDNEAYMNTGIQRSGATPLGAATTTAPAGTKIPGKMEFHKDLTKIAIAHNIPYIAQASPHNYMDLYKKAKKAFETKGPAFLNVIMPCTLGWRFPTDIGIDLAKLAVDTCFWPLYEVENGVYKLNYKPKEKKPMIEYMKLQGRFKHLFKPENAWVIDKLQKHVDEQWDWLQKQCVEE